jgi:hypothetical protein
MLCPDIVVVEVKRFFASESNRNSGSFSKPVELFHSGNQTLLRTGRVGRMLQNSTARPGGKTAYYERQLAPALRRHPKKNVRRLLR